MKQQGQEQYDATLAVNERGKIPDTLRHLNYKYLTIAIFKHNRSLTYTFVGVCAIIKNIFHFKSIRMSLRKLRNTDRIQNIQSNTPKPVIGSWKKYWCDQSGELWPETCRFRGCGDNADGSAHVIVNYDEDFEYIIPICDDHREISEIFSVNSGTLAVRIDKEEIITELVENLVEKYGKLHLKGGMRVQNIQGTNVCHPRGRKRGTWKKFWLRHSDSEWPSLCRVRHCMEQAEGGAHVRMKKKCGVFIVPMCGKHNNAQNQDWYSVEEHTIAVRVDEEDTSGPVGPCYL